MICQPSSLLPAFACVAMCLLATAPAQGQPREQGPARRPFRPLFGSGMERPGSTQSLDLTASFDVSYDDNVLADRLPGGDPRVGESGIYPAGTVDLRYAKRMRGVSLSASGGSTGQYYSAVASRSFDRSHYAAAGVDVEVTRQTRLRLAQTASYATYYTLLGLPGSGIADPSTILPGQELLAPAAQFGVASEAGWEYHTGASVSQQLGRGGSLDGRYGFARTRFGSSLTTYHETGIGYQQAITRQAGLRFGYGYQEGTGGVPGEIVTFHNLDLGINYRRNLPGLRNTSMAITTGSAVMAGEEGHEYRLLADATLVHLFGRAWTASAGYHRGTDFVSALSSLASTDGATASVTGYLNPALETSVAGNYSAGYLGSRHGDRMTTYSTAARIRYALSPRIALHAQYFYYYYQLAETVVLPAGIAPELARQAIRVGFTLGLPLVR